MNRFSFLLVLALCALASTSAFTSQVVSQARVVAPAKPNFARFYPALLMASEDGVVELADDEDESAPAAVAVETKQEEKVVAPFLSQGEISEDAMKMDMSDPKQARVMFYIILSLLPVLFLIPLMLGSRDLIPQEMLPPVELN